MPFVSVLALAWLYQAPGLEGQEYLGARAVLSKILKPPNGSVLKDVKFVFAGDLRSFERYSPSMSPSAAASSWLDLAQRSFAIADTDSTPGQSGLAPVLSALPSPNSWPLIQAGLKDRDFGDPARGPAIHLLMDVLQGKTKDAWADLEAFAKLRTDSTRVSELDWLRLALAMHWHDSDRIDSAVTHEADMTASENGVLFGGGPSMQIPDLVVLLGKARARKRGDRAQGCD